MGDTDYPIEDYTEEDNWRYVEKSLAMKPTKPVIDGEPSYENIPQGLHDPKECYGKPVMSAAMLTGRFLPAHSDTHYGNNSIMQMKKRIGGAYGAKKPW